MKIWCKIQVVIYLFPYRCGLGKYIYFLPLFYYIPGKLSLVSDLRRMNDEMITYARSRKEIYHKSSECYFKKYIKFAITEKQNDKANDLDIRSIVSQEQYDEISKKLEEISLFENTVEIEKNYSELKFRNEILYHEYFKEIKKEKKEVNLENNFFLYATNLKNRVKGNAEVGEVKDIKNFYDMDNDINYVNFPSEKNEIIKKEDRDNNLENNYFRELKKKYDESKDFFISDRDDKDQDIFEGHKNVYTLGVLKELVESYESNISLNSR